MTRRIVLVRHAKSSWEDESLPDHDRPLAPRGEAALPAMRAHVATLDLPALIVLCSTAVRAAATFEGIRPALSTDTRIESDRAFYYADEEELLSRVARLGSEHESVMIVGHNPTLQDLACTLIGGGDAGARGQIAAKVPTGSIMTMSVDRPWAALAPGAAHLDSLFMPRAPRT